MRLEQLQHIIRACAALTDEYEIVIIGAAALLGVDKPLMPELTQTREADVYPFRAPEKSDLIDAALGEGSQFDRTFGYYAHGIGPETAVLPSGWEHRLLKLQSPATDGKIGYCLDPYDLAASKLIAGRPKDYDFVRALLNNGILEAATLVERLQDLPVTDPRTVLATEWLDARSKPRKQVKP